MIDSTEAVKRLAEPDPKDHERLSRSPGSLSIFTLLWRDSDLGLLVAAVVAALAAAAIFVLR